IFALKEGKERISETDLILLKETLNRLVFDVLGLQKIEENNNEKLDQALQILINLRNEARKAKNWELSDQIRDQLLEKGIELKDGKEGTTYSLS
ncbi:cysteine--tRNA ligase, partial [Escherichia coli]|nr:cysteine--tRNA ligase [Escherichia coli]